MNILQRKKMILIRSIELDLPLAQIARDAGVTRTAIYHIMFNRVATVWLRRLICKRLKFKPSDLDWPEDILST